MRLAILGFGQIGGSVAMALHRRASHRWSVTAWSPSRQGPERAAAAGVIAAAPTTVAAAVDRADVVLLAAPPLACLGLLDDLAGPLRARLRGDVVVTDVASTKRRLVERAAVLGLPFVGGHPMAGREASGYAAADPGLFIERPWIVCEGPRADAVEQLATDLGARPVRMTASRHDAAVAAISHLPLVLSAALTEAVLGRLGERASADDVDPRRLAAGGWASMTRLARGDPEMGAGILATNADEVAARLRDARDAIDLWLGLLETPEPDAEALRERLEAARAALTEEA